MHFSTYCWKGSNQVLRERGLEIAFLAGLRLIPGTAWNT